MKRDRIVICHVVLNVVLAVTACTLFYRFQQSQQSLRQAEMRLKYERMVLQLLIPAEALYRDTLNPDHNRIFRQICELRMGYFPERFLPYAAVMRPGAATVHQSEEPTFIWNGSFETFWINEAPKGLADLASEIENSSEFGAYIRARAEDKGDTMVSLTERLLGSPNSDHRIRAARLLLALGHRDRKVLDVVKAFAKEGMRTINTDQGTMMEYSRERNTALELDTQYDLGIRNQVANKPSEATR